MTSPKVVWVDDPAGSSLSTNNNEASPPPSTEEYRDAVGYVDPESGLPSYEVSNFGNVKALPRTGMQHSFIVSRWTKQVSGGYERAFVTLRISKGHTRSQRVDELVLNTFVGPRPGPTWGPSFHDGNTLNVVLDNLAWERGKGRAARGTGKKARRAAKPTTTKTQDPTPEQPSVEAKADLPTIFETQEAIMDRDGRDVISVKPMTMDIDLSVEDDIRTETLQIQEWHRYVLGDLDIVTTPDGVDIARTDEEGTPIERISLTDEQAVSLQLLLAKVV